MMDGDPQASAEAAEMRARVHRAINLLPARQQRVIRWRFGIGCREATLSECGARLGISRERVRQVDGSRATTKQ